MDQLTVHLDIDYSDATKAISVLQKSLEGLQETAGRIRIDVDGSGIDKVVSQIKQLDSVSPSVAVDVDDSKVSKAAGSIKSMIPDRVGVDVEPEVSSAASTSVVNQMRVLADKAVSVLERSSFGAAISKAASSASSAATRAGKSIGARIGAAMERSAAEGGDIVGGLSRSVTRSSGGLKRIGVRVGSTISESIPAALERGINTIGGKVSPAFADIGSKLGGVLGKAMKNPYVAAMVAAMAAVASVGLVAFAGFKQKLEREKVSVGLQIQLGLDEEDAGRVQQRVKAVFNDGFGENKTQVIDAATAFVRGLGEDTVNALSDEQIETNIAFLATVETHFERSPEEVADAMRALVKSGVADSLEEARDVITVSLQIDASGDSIDTFREYSTEFQQLGLTAPGVAAAFDAMFEAGGRSTDYLADLLKETGIKLQELDAAATQNGLRQLGLDGAEIGEMVSKGGDDAVLAYSLVLASLGEVEAANERNAIAVALFGTKFEDLSETAVFAAGEQLAAARHTGEAWQQAGVAVETSSSATQQALAAIGLSADFVNTKTVQGVAGVGEAYSHILVGLEEVDDAQKRNLISVELFGKTYEEVMKAGGDSAEVLVEQTRQVVDAADDALKLEKTSKRFETIRRTVLSKFSDATVKVYDGLAALFDNPAVQVAMAELGAVWRNDLQPMLAQFADEVLPQLVDEFGPFLKDTLIPFLRDDLVPFLVDTLLPFVIEVLPIWAKAFTEYMSFVFKQISAVIKVVGLIGKAFTTVLRVVKTVVSGIISAFNGVVSALKAVASSIGNVFSSAFSGLTGTAKSAANSIVSFFKGIPSRIGGFVSGITDKFNDVRTQALKLVDSIVSFFKGIPGRIGGSILGTVTNAARGIGGVVGVVSNAYGGAYSTPTFSSLSEYGHPEAVISSLASPAQNFGYLQQAGLDKMLAPTFLAKYSAADAGSSSSVVNNITVESSTTARSVEGRRQQQMQAAAVMVNALREAMGAVK